MTRTEQTSTPVWQPRGNGLFCPLHRKSFGRNETCAKCDDTLWEKEGFADLTAPIDSPDGCETLEQHERVCTDAAVFFERREPMVGLKYRTLAVQLATARERAERTRRLAQHEKMMADRNAH